MSNHSSIYGVTETTLAMLVRAKRHYPCWWEDEKCKKWLERRWAVADRSPRSLKRGRPDSLNVCRARYKSRRDAHSLPVTETCFQQMRSLSRFWKQGLSRVACGSGYDRCAIDPLLYTYFHGSTDSCAYVFISNYTHIVVTDEDLHGWHIVQIDPVNFLDCWEFFNWELCM